MIKLREALLISNRKRDRLRKSALDIRYMSTDKRRHMNNLMTTIIQAL